MLKLIKSNLFFGSSCYVNLITESFNKDPYHQYNLKELRDKSNKVFENNKDLYSSMLTYNAGNCWFNHKISRGDPITEVEQKNFDNIVKAKELVEPLSYPINLYHGFELGVKYPQFEKEKVIDFNIILSKTPCWYVANFFAKNNISLWNKYMFIMYPPNTKHLNIDVRDKQNEEWEYLSVNEKLRYKDNVYHLSLFPYPQIHIYHIFEYVS